MRRNLAKAARIGAKEARTSAVPRAGAPGRSGVSWPPRQAHSLAAAGLAHASSPSKGPVRHPAAASRPVTRC
jgi:hypothetical protein